MFSSNISYNKKCSGRKYLNASFYPGPGERSFHLLQIFSTVDLIGIVHSYIHHF